MKIVSLILPLLLSLHPFAQKTFYWQWQTAGDSLQLTGRLNEEPVTVVHLGKASIKKPFALLYRNIDETRYKEWNDYQKTVAFLSKATVQPFQRQLLACNRVVVEMDSGLLNLPLEFLQVQNNSLALFRPLVFRINGFAGKQGNDTLTLHRGFLLRDPTSDPEDAVTSIFRRYPASTFRSVSHIKPADFQFRPGADFALMSAHGFADSATLRGCIFFANDSPVRPRIFEQSQLKLVYIDGCQQGINWSYISKLAQAESTVFYLGPIVSNDSGESSTKTINWLFDALRQSHNPVEALWITRKHLHNHYKNVRKLNSTDVVNKSLIFRIYKL